MPYVGGRTVLSQLGNGIIRPRQKGYGRRKRQQGYGPRRRQHGYSLRRRRVRYGLRRRQRGHGIGSALLGAMKNFVLPAAKRILLPAAKRVGKSVLTEAIKSAPGFLAATDKKTFAKQAGRHLLNTGINSGINTVLRAAGSGSHNTGNNSGLNTAVRAGGGGTRPLSRLGIRRHRRAGR